MLLGYVGLMNFIYILCQSFFVGSIAALWQCSGRVGNGSGDGEEKAEKPFSQWIYSGLHEGQASRRQGGKCAYRAAAQSAQLNIAVGSLLVSLGHSVISHKRRQGFECSTMSVLNPST